MQTKVLQRQRIHYRIRKKVRGVSDRPRLHVFRSNKGIYCQLIDDLTATTLVAASSKEITGGGSKSEIAQKVGGLIAEKAKAMNIDSVVFDRGGYLYHGRVKSLADGARASGLNF